MNIQKILGGPPGIMLGIGLSRLVPPRVGYWIARQVARRMARGRSPKFTVAKRNLAHVVGPKVSEEELERMAEYVVYHAGCTYYDMFRFAGSYAKVRVDPDEWALAEATLRDERGTIVVGPHMSNFDLAGLWIAAQGFEMQALSLPKPERGGKILNLFRRHQGLLVTPVNLRSLRMAAERLKAGGIVVTGVDRPVSLADEPVLFFDAPARMPSGHVRLALQTDARILVACCIQASDGYYEIQFAPPLEVERTGDRKRDVRHNVRRVLEIIERMIRQAPEQWPMFVPVWDFG